MQYCIQTSEYQHYKHVISKCFKIFIETYHYPHGLI